MSTNKLMIAIGFAALLAAAGSARAQHVEYFIVKDLRAQACAVVDQRPTETTSTAIVDNGKTYKNRAEAIAGLLANPACWQ